MVALKRGNETFDSVIVEALRGSQESGHAARADRFHGEVTVWQRTPGWLGKALGFAKGNAYPDKLGVVILHERESGPDLVVLSLEDFRNWFGELRVRMYPVGRRHFDRSEDERPGLGDDNREGE